MNKKLKKAILVDKVVDAFKCPLCESPMKVVDQKSLLCSNKHTFDFTKQGYVNMMTHASNSHYSQKLFEARYKIIMESDLYSAMHEAIAKAIKDHVHNTKPLMIADLGCGEGSHLQRIMDKCGFSEMTGVGLDISKEGIVMAAKRYDTPIWLVGDLAKSPLNNQSFNVILNILSPSNYAEFNRILSQEGIVIKVVPGSNYLKELRSGFFDNKEKKEYKNDQIVSLLKKHFNLVDSLNLSYSKQLTKQELENLIQMTPLAWSADKADIEKFIDRDAAEISVELEILVGKRIVAP